jgi:hypothetical protein
MSDGDYETLNALVEEYRARCLRGENPDTAEYCLRYPNLADKIRQVFPAALLMEQAGKPDQLRLSTTIGCPFSGPTAPILQQIGDYRIVREIGRGGMGIVYEAQQQSLGRRVALKVLPPGTPGTPGDTLRFQRFEREARAAAKLHHTNIVPVIGVGNDDGVHYIVLQLIDGCGLHEVIAELRRLQQAQQHPDRDANVPVGPSADRQRADNKVRTITSEFLAGGSATAADPEQFDRGKQSTTTRRSSNSHR